MTVDELRSFDESLPMALLKARESAMQLFRPLLAEADLTEQQWRVLRALSAASPLDVGELAAQTFLLGPSLTRILGNLADRDLLSRSTDPEDQRRSLMSLTAAGEQLVRRVGPDSETAYARIEAEFGTTRLRALIADLHDFANLPLDQ